MAYLGNAPARSFISFERQVFTIVNSQTAYTLSHSVNNENDIRLVINNIVQEPGSGKAYTASGTTLTLSAALTNGTDEMYCVFLGRATATNAPSAGSVNTAAIADLNVTTAKIAADAITEAKIADDAVESEHLNNNVISGQTELAATPADTDELLISDAGTIKRIDYSYLKSTGLSMVDQWRLSTNFDVGTSNTVFDSNLEQIDTSGQTTVGSAMSESSGIFTFPSTGKYLVHALASYYRNADRRFCKIQIDIGTSGSYTQIAQAYGHIKVIDSNHTYTSPSTSTIVNIGNTSNDTVRFIGAGSGDTTAAGSTSVNATTFTFIKLD